MYSSYQRDTSASTGLDESAALGILKHLDNSELQRLLDDDGHLRSYIQDLPQVKNLELEKTTLLTSNKSLAEFNLSCEPRLHSGRRQLATTYENAVKLQKEFDQKKQKLDMHAAEQSLDTTLCLLQTEMAKSEEESEKIADEFVETDTEVGDFLKQFVDKRKEAHLRRVKVEKMTELLRERTRQQQQRAAAAPFPAQWDPAQAQHNNWSAATASNGPTTYPASYYPR